MRNLDHIFYFIDGKRERLKLLQEKAAQRNLEKMSKRDTQEYTYTIHKTPYHLFLKARNEFNDLLK